jgi:DNA repair protein RadC
MAVIGKNSAAGARRRARHATGRPTDGLRWVRPAIQIRIRRVALSLGVADQTASPIGDVVTDARDAAPIARAAIGSEIAECVLVTFLDARNRVTGYSEVARGTVNAARLSARDLLVPTLYANAATVVAAHNHPSGDPTPSRADHTVTAVLRDAARLVGITLVDHIIVTPTAHFSFRSQERWDDQ